MNWIKVGHIFCADENSESMRTYGRMPTPLHIKDDLFRIYFESRTDGNVAHPYFLDIEIHSPARICKLETSPLLQFGKPGTFDDNGITPFSVFNDGDLVKMYYAGWTRDVKVPFHNAIGLAVSHDGGLTFQKSSAGPVLERDYYDPYFPTGPCVLKENNRYVMWYTSFEKWEETDGLFKHYYNIKRRTSPDGIDWREAPTTSIDFGNEHEYAFVVRSVIRSNDTYKMWYSFRAQAGIDTYRIGYAESRDGIHWQRLDANMAGLDVSADGWDSEMICYPKVFEHNGNYYMLYNGNGYGRTGFGLAVLENS